MDTGGAALTRLGFQIPNFTIPGTQGADVLKKALA